jgi:hypothetical protein
MKSNRRNLIAVLVLFGIGNAGFAATVPGMVGDGMPTVFYDFATGEMGIQPDGNPIGLFDIESASSIFTADAILPPDALFTTNTQFRKSWSALPASAFESDFSLGIIAPPGLTFQFLLNNLTLIGSGGFGTPSFPMDLFSTIPEPATAFLGGLGMLFLACFRRRR